MCHELQRTQYATGGTSSRKEDVGYGSVTTEAWTIYYS